MLFPAMNRTRSYRVTVPQLSGGINYAEPPHRIADNQLADALNLWWRHGQLKTRPALRGIAALGDKSDTRVAALGSRACLLSRSDGAVGALITLIDEEGTAREYRYTEDTVVNLFAAAVNHNSAAALSDNDAILYCQGRRKSGVWGLSDGQLHELTPYVPTVLMNGRPQETACRRVTGDPLEPYNLLSEEYRCTYTPDGKNAHYYLPTVDDTVLEIVYRGTIRGSYGEEPHTLAYDKDSGLYLDTSLHKASGFLAAYSPVDGHFWFYECLPEGIVSTPDPQVPVPLPEGGDNCVSVRVRRTDAAMADGRAMLFGMRFSTWFGGGTAGLSGGTRLFVAGHPQHPNRVQWSALNNPLYFPENNYAYVGADTSAVTAFGKQSDMLVVFKETELYYTTYTQGSSVSADEIEAATVTDIEAAAAYFPFMQIHPEIGCDCPATVQLCNNRLVWLNSDGYVYGLFSSGVYNERNVRRLSLQLGDALRAFPREDLRAASATRCEEQYLLLVGQRQLYVMDFSSYGFTYYGSYSSDERAQRQVVWHRWQTETPLEHLLRVGDTPLLIGRGRDSDSRRYLFGLSELTDRDDRPNGAEASTPFAASSPIPVRLCTKHFDFDAPERYKRVSTLYLQLSGTRGDTVSLTCHDGAGTHSNTAHCLLDGTPPERTAPQALHPNLIRVRHCGLELTCNGALSVGSLVFHYSTMGAIRA